MEQRNDIAGIFRDPREKGAGEWRTIAAEERERAKCSDLRKQGTWGDRTPTNSKVSSNTKRAR